jgi:hypothetical protein
MTYHDDSDYEKEQYRKAGKLPSWLASKSFDHNLRYYMSSIHFLIGQNPTDNRQLFELVKFCIDLVESINENRTKHKIKLKDVENFEKYYGTWERPVINYRQLGEWSEDKDSIIPVEDSPLEYLSGEPTYLSIRTEEKVFQFVQSGEVNYEKLWTVMGVVQNIIVCPELEDCKKDKKDCPCNLTHGQYQKIETRLDSTYLISLKAKVDQKLMKYALAVINSITHHIANTYYQNTQFKDDDLATIDKYLGKN